MPHLPRLVVAAISAAIVSASAVSALAAQSAPPSGANDVADLAPEQVAKMGWDALPVILSHIKAPTFPDKNFPITDYGAKADGVTDCTDAISKAIQACHDAGGGHVVIPDGVTMTGAVHLLSNVDLHLSDKATLQFMRDLSKYYPLVLTRSEGTEYQNYSPLIYAFEQENIGITGNGTLDGGGESWWAPAVRADGGLRPVFVQPFRCKNVLIEGLTVHNSPMWEITPAYCTNVIVRNMHIESTDANNDGCDPDSCKYVLIDGCTFKTGDDCIAIKCGKNDDGRRVNIPSEFLIIRNCQMLDGHGGVTMGSECTPAIRNVFIENCKMDSPRLNIALRFKDNAARGGVIENVYMRNCTIGQVGQMLTIDLRYGEGANGNYKPIVRNVNVSNVTVDKAQLVTHLARIPDSILENINISDSTFKSVYATEPTAEGVTFTMKNVTVTPGSWLPASATSGRANIASGELPADYGIPLLPATPAVSAPSNAPATPSNKTP